MGEINWTSPMNVLPDLWPNAFLHTLDPFAIRFNEMFGIRWYGLAYLAGFYLGYLFIRWVVSRSELGFPKALASDFVFAAALGTVIGGRVGYAVFYAPALFFEFSSDAPFWGLIALHKGGMASHGGIIGLIIACAIFAKKYGLNYLTLLDLTTIGGTAGIFLGRIANFINGELYGRIAPPEYPLAVKFPTEIPTWIYTDPERLPELKKAVVLVGTSQEHWLGYLAQRDIYQIERITTALVDRIQHGSVAIANELAPAIPGRYPSQLFEGFLEGFFLLVILLFLWRKPRAPGFIASIFLITYPIARFIGEGYRLPDLGIGYQLLGLTRGQWLSVGMLLLGVIFFIKTSRLGATKIGGWRRYESD